MGGGCPLKYLTKLIFAPMLRSLRTYIIKVMFKIICKLYITDITFLRFKKMAKMKKKLIKKKKNTKLQRISKSKMLSQLSMPQKPKIVLKGHNLVMERSHMKFLKSKRASTADSLFHIWGKLEEGLFSLQ